MRFLLLAAVYNHTQDWLENLIWSMEQQFHKDWHMVIIDDRPADMQLRHRHVKHLDRVSLINCVKRMPSLMAKYQFAISLQEFGSWDACCVLDDDDIYLPRFLNYHADLFDSGFPWSYPHFVYTFHERRISKIETGNKYWASSAYTARALWKCPFAHDPQMGFDQKFLTRMSRELPNVGRQHDPTYVYNWDGQMLHTSVLSENFYDTKWYDRTQPVPCAGIVEPKQHIIDSRIREMIKENYPNV
jgi:hypothetical protein